MADVPARLSRPGEQDRSRLSQLALKLVLAVCQVMALVGCGSTPAGPSAERYAQPRVSILCQPSGPSVTCTATMYDVPRWQDSQDVTALASWLVSDPSVADLVAPGVLKPKRRGEVDVSAQYQQLPTDMGDWWFLVDPQQAAQFLYWVAGIVRDGDTQVPLSDVRVEILSGYASGASGVSNQAGSYKIDRILTQEVFSIRASKDGYASQTVTYRVDPPVGPAGGNPPWVNFNLHRVQ